MSEASRKIIEILDQAVELEKQGLKAYLEYARMTDDRTGKDMFILLARDEFDHMSLIEKIQEEYAGTGNFPRKKAPKSAFANILPKLKDIKSFSQGQEGVNQSHALEMALKFEDRARDMYQQLADMCKSDEAKGLFLTLVEIEQGHYDLLNAQKESISGTGLWAEIPDMGMEYLES